MESNSRILELLVEQKVRKARTSFWSFRQLMNPGMKDGWWQREIARELQEFAESFLAGDAPRLVIQAPPQHGKLCADHTPVFTPDGWRTHGDLKAGDYVYHPSGKPVKVISVTDKHPADMRVTLGNGEEIYCHERHEWTVFNRNKKRYETVETMDMIKPGARSGNRNPLYTGEKGKRGCHYTYKLPNVSPISSCDKTLPVDPYVLGVWLGDGAQTKPYITYQESDSKIIDSISDCGYCVGQTYVHKTTGVLTTKIEGLFPQLLYAGVATRDYGVRKKHIPEIYLTSSLQQRLQLLAGLIDTDGYCYQKNGRVVFTTSDTRLADTFCELISTFGWGFSRVTEQPKVSSSGIVGKSEYFVIGFNPSLEIPCRLHRKKGPVRNNDRKTAIVSIDRDNQGYVGHCIQVDSEDGLYLVGRTMQPTHNSIQIIDLIAWIAGLDPSKKAIYTSFSNRLGIRANLRVRRMMANSMYGRIFPDTHIYGCRPDTPASDAIKNSDLLEYVNSEGYFRNTTVNGSITGESLDLGVIDDPIKGRKDANSKTIRDAAWDWFTDDFFTRFDESAALLAILTRWHVDDPIGRLIEKDPDIKVLSYQAIATKEEPNRKEGEALFPEHKSIKFLLQRKSVMDSSSWESLYQQSPFVKGGEIIKGKWFGRYTMLPKLKWRACFGDTAVKAKQSNDYQVALCAGLGDDGKLYLIDLMRDKFEAYLLEKRFPDFFEKHRADKTTRLRFFGIEDKASGSELIQKMKNVIKPKIPVKAIPRNTDKYSRVQDILGYIESGFIVLPDNAAWVHDFVAECEAFTADDAHDHDDQIDVLCDAISLMLNQGSSSIRDML